MKQSRGKKKREDEELEEQGNRDEPLQDRIEINAAVVWSFKENGGEDDPPGGYTTYRYRRYDQEEDQGKDG